MTELALRRPSTASAVNRLVRLGSVAAAAAICLVGAYLAPPVAIRSLALGLAAVGAAVATANVFNDINDVDADQVNVPERPLPSGAISVKAAWVWFAGFLLTAIASGWLISRYHAVWVGLMIGLSIWYSVQLKRVVILGGLVVGVLLATALLFGASLGSSLGSGQRAALIPGSIEIALFTFGRETLKGIRDVEGDRRVGVFTMAGVWGRRPAILVFLAAGAGVVVPAYLSGSLLHLVGMTLLVAVPAAFMGLGCLRSGDDQTIRSAIGRSAWLWVTGLIGIALLGV